jgi:tryptophan synthase alpha chain
MNRIQQTFAKRKAQNEATLVGFLMAGDPTIEDSERDIRAALDAGVDVIELGVPFSDPTADGPVIQAAGQRALAAGMTLGRTIELAGRIRRDYQNPIILFGYVNLFFSHGYEATCREAGAAGVDGLLVVDMPYEESGELRQAAARHGLVMIPLIAPTTPDKRMGLILKDAGGFVYYIMVRGVTGARDAVALDVGPQLLLLRAHTNLPIAAGFGVRDGAQAQSVAAYADGVVVGSALVKAAQEKRVGPLVREIRAALAR